MPTDKGNHSRTGKGAETAITPDCTLCYMKGFLRVFRLMPGCAGLKLAISISSMRSLRLILRASASSLSASTASALSFQFDTLQPTIFIAFKLIAFIDAQLFIARKRIGFRSSRATLIREQI
jgi:hypothetical protein